MSRPSSCRVVLPILVLMAFAVGACDERSAPTQPAPEEPNRAICGSRCVGTLPPRFSMTSLAVGGTLPIGGVRGSYTVTLSNSGFDAADVVLAGYILQGAAYRRSTGSALIDCHAGLGVLPSGSCEVTLPITVGSTMNGDSEFVTGGAIFELDLVVGGIPLLVRMTAVNLLAADFRPTGSAAFSLSGANGAVGLHIDNPGGAAASGLSYQTTVIQGDARRSAGTVPLACPGGNSGELPAFTWGCDMTLSVGVSNTNSGSGTLVAGPAIMRVDLLQNQTVLSTRILAISLVDARHGGVRPSANVSVLEGQPQYVGIVFSNNGPPVMGAAFRGIVQQGTATREATIEPVSCGAGLGVIPQGDCSQAARYFASNRAPGSGTLQPGAATLVLITTASTPNGTVVVDSTTHPIKLGGFVTFTP